jgi:LasA protease
LRKTGLLVLLLWLFLSMACNYPVVQYGATSPNPPALTTQASGVSSPGTPEVQLVTPPAVQATGVPLFFDLATATPNGIPSGNSATPVPASTFSYYAQSGDILDAVAKRFGVQSGQISSAQEIPTQGMIPPGQLLTIPNAIGTPAYPSALLPDSEVIDSPTSLDFDIQDYLTASGGYLNSYSQLIGSERLTGAEIVQRVAENTSTNPRLLLAVVEFRSHWVSSVPSTPELVDPLGFQVPGYTGLYLELSLVGKLLNMGYYGWRQGSLTELTFTDGPTARLAPQLNAGSVALQYLFARLYKEGEWQAKLYGTDGLAYLYEKMFGDPWKRAARVEPLFPTGMQFPTLDLPFASGEAWSFTAGPHPDWNTGTPPGALDFAPITGEPPCSVSAAWARAAAPGVIIRTGDGVVVQDLDGDGREQTGWVLVYLHIAQKDRVAPGARLMAGDPIGHPSCEGGDATGSHVHLARKFNGEWIGANSSWPFVLSGWTAVPGAAPYAGTLVKGDQVVTAHPDGSHGSTIMR